jgi:hypothetical protein
LTRVAEDQQLRETKRHADAGRAPRMIDTRENGETLSADRIFEPVHRFSGERALFFVINPAVSFATVCLPSEPFASCGSPSRITPRSLLAEGSMLTLVGSVRRSLPSRGTGRRGSVADGQAHDGDLLALLDDDPLSEPLQTLVLVVPQLVDGDRLLGRRG